MLVVRESKSQLLYNVLKTVKLLLNPVTILIGVYTRLCGLVRWSILYNFKL